MRRAVVIAGTIVLGLVATVGVILSAAYVIVSSDIGRGFLVPRLVRLADDALAGSIELRNFRVLPGGGIELVGVRVFDPSGEEVLRAERLQVYPDLSRVRSKAIGFRVQLDGAAVFVRREQDGSISLARAFEPTHPAPKGQPSGPPTWTIRLTRFAARDASLRYQDVGGSSSLSAEGLALDGRASYGPRGARIELAARGTMVQPERAPLSLQIAGGLRDSELSVRTFRFAVGDTALELAADLDVVSWRGRAALLALTADATQLHEAFPAVPLAANIDGTAYLESDGSRATAALELRAPGGGTAEGAAAVRLPPGAVAAGAELHVTALDLARVIHGAPPSRITLAARGRGAGNDLSTLHGAVTASLAASSFRGGSIGPAELRATAGGGAIDVAQLDAVAPGGTIRARGRWQESGAIGGHAVVDAANLRLLVRNLQLLLDRPLPALEGGGQVVADFSGTTAAPSLTLRLVAPKLALASASTSGLDVRATLAGPLSSPTASVEGTASSLVAGNVDVRSVRIGANVRGRAGEIELTGQMPELGREPLTIRAAGALSRDARAVQLSALTLAWPGDRFELQSPAVISLAQPSVDRLVLASGPQRIVLSGGISGAGRRQTIEARAQLENLDLALLPPALVPRTLGLAGRVGGDVSVSGPVASPRVKGSVELADASVMGIAGVSANGQLGYDGGQRRAQLDLALRRAQGGELELHGDIPVLLSRAKPTAHLAVTVIARRWPVDELLHALDMKPPQPLQGIVTLDARLGGTKGAPTLEGTATLDDGRYGELEPFALNLHVVDVGSEAKLRGTMDYRGARALDVDASLPVSAATLVAEPAAVARRMPALPLAVVASVPGFDLASIAGRAGVPEDVRGRLTARMELKGTARQPRGAVTAGLANASYAGYADVGGEVKLVAGDGSTTIHATVSRSGDVLAQAFGSLSRPPERLVDQDEREHAPIALRIDVPHAELARATSGTPVPVSGDLEALVGVTGSLADPRVEVGASGRNLEVSGHPLGDVAIAVRADSALHATLRLSVATGGTLEASVDADTGVGLPLLRAGRVRAAPARAKVVTHDLDLAFVPALAPRTVRSASGKLEADIVAAGPLARMVPRGTISMKDGAVSVAEFSEWTHVALQASISEDVVRVDRFTAKRRDGTLTFTATARGLARRDAPADVTGELRTSGLTIPHAGQDLATVDIDANLHGTVSSRALDLEITIPSATVKLPSRPPRSIQSLEPRTDIVVGAQPKKASVVAASSTKAEPYLTKVHVVAPGRFLVKSDNPRMSIDLRADVTAEYQRDLVLTGDIDTVRGQIEPISGRIFDLKRARVQFTGGALKTAVLEIQAFYDNPTAKVNVAITGTVAHPDIKLTSEPPMDESQIALLIATGHTDLKPDSGGVGTLNAAETGTAALGAVATQLFMNTVADKLPVDSVSIDSSQLRAGKYVTDKIYVGYTHRYNAKVEQGENPNEVRVEYQISPHWTFESRYGDAQSGGASVLWTKDY